LSLKQKVRPCELSRVWLIAFGNALGNAIVGEAKAYEQAKIKRQRENEQFVADMENWQKNNTLDFDNFGGLTKEGIDEGLRVYREKQQTEGAEDLTAYTISGRFEIPQEVHFGNPLVALRGAMPRSGPVPPVGGPVGVGGRSGQPVHADPGLAQVLRPADTSPGIFDGLMQSLSDWGAAAKLSFDRFMGGQDFNAQGIAAWVNSSLEYAAAGNSARARENWEMAVARGGNFFDEDYAYALNEGYIVTTNGSFREITSEALGSTALPISDEVGAWSTLFPASTEGNFFIPGFESPELSWLNEPGGFMSHASGPWQTETPNLSDLAGPTVYLSEKFKENEFELPEYTLRGDDVGPDVVFEKGFKGRGTSTDVFAHAVDNREPASIYVSTSSSSDVAIDFGTDHFTAEGFMYTIRPDSRSIDVNEYLGWESPHYDEFEIVIPYRVLPSDVRGVTPLNSDGSYVGYSILNPNWKP
jgi:hypothetical protein